VISQYEGRLENRKGARMTWTRRYSTELAAGPKVLLALALGIGVRIGHGQWLETKITLPDSLGGATSPFCLTADTSERYVYIGDGSGAVYVVDAEARTRVAKLACGYVSAICTNTRQNKVYAADYEGDQVFVISCATNQVVATIPTCTNPLALCYNGADDKIYVAGYVYLGHADLTVIDCTSDQVIKTIHLEAGQPSLCYSPAGNRVFCAVYDTLLVIDGATDSVVAVRDGKWYGPMVANAVANRVYASGSGGVNVLDGTTGEVLETMNAAADVICLNPRTQKLYAAGDHPVQLAVFDCTADTIINRFQFRGTSYVYSLACDAAANKVYVSCYWFGHRIVVIDGDTDTIATKLWGPNQDGLQGGSLASSRRGRVYFIDHGGPELAVLDTGTDSLLLTVVIGGMSVPTMCYDSIDDKVYYVSCTVLGEVGAIDAATNQPVGHIQVGRYPEHVIWHAPTKRLYCGGANVTVIDTKADTVVKVLEVGSWMMCSAPPLNKVYLFQGNALAVLDCGSDSVVKTIPIPTEYAWSMCYVAYDKLYIGGIGGVSIIDCVGDTLIRSYPFGFCRLVVGRDGKRVHCWRPYSFSTFDVAGDTLISEVPYDASGGENLIYVPGVDKIYCACPAGGQDRILVVDAKTDSVIAVVPFYQPAPLGYDSVNGLVYCGQLTDSAVVFMDSRTDSIVRSFNPCANIKSFTMVPAHSRVYVGNAGNSFIPVIRTDPLGVEETLQSLTLEKLSVPTMVSRQSPLVVHRPSVLLDAVGRKVLDAKPGQHSLTRYRAGVYFLRNCRDGDVVKILLVD